MIVLLNDCMIHMINVLEASNYLRNQFSIRCFQKVRKYKHSTSLIERLFLNDWW